jgi:hypothetical protein
MGRKSCIKQQKMVIWRVVCSMFAHELDPGGMHISSVVRCCTHFAFWSISVCRATNFVRQTSQGATIRIGDASRGERAVSLSTSQAVRQAVGGRPRPGYCEKCAAWGTDIARNAQHGAQTNCEM